MKCVCGKCRRCKGRVIQARYKKTAKGKATERRYQTSAKGVAAHAKYTSSDKWKAVVARRVKVGDTYSTQAETPEQAAMIRTHIKERLRAFERQQARAEAESA